MHILSTQIDKWHALVSDIRLEITPCRKLYRKEIQFGFRSRWGRKTEREASASKLDIQNPENRQSTSPYCAVKKLNLFYLANFDYNCTANVTMSSNTSIAIAGFTGKMARLITTSLLQNHPNVKIHGICRSPDKIDENLRSNPNITIFGATSNDIPVLRRALAGTSVCICAYLGDNTLMIDGQKALIDACIAEDVPRYIASDWTLDFRGLELGDHPTKDPMKHVQRYLEEKESEGKIKGVHVLNGAFMQVIWASFMGYVDTEKGMFRYFGTGDEKLETTTYEDAAAFTAEVALDPNANGFLKGEGPRNLRHRHPVGYH
jgi:hypothetical protein